MTTGVWRDLNSADLLRECGSKPDEDRLWQEFESRFKRLILLYLLRACRLRHQTPDKNIQDLLLDLSQEVYSKLVQNDRRALASFRGETDFSVRAFLARVANSVVADHLRYSTSQKRSAKIIPIDILREHKLPTVNEAESHASRLDLERNVESATQDKNGQRNFLIFQLHFIEGFTSEEIAEFPGFKLRPPGVAQVLSKLKARIRHA